MSYILLRPAVHRVQQSAFSARARTLNRAHARGIYHRLLGARHNNYN